VIVFFAAVRRARTHFRIFVSSDLESRNIRLIFILVNLYYLHLVSLYDTDAFQFSVYKCDPAYNRFHQFLWITLRYYIIISVVYMLAKNKKSSVKQADWE